VCLLRCQLCTAPGRQGCVGQRVSKRLGTAVPCPGCSARQVPVPHGLCPNKTA
jgi:hypothetical protein